VGRLDVREGAAGDARSIVAPAWHKHWIQACSLLLKIGWHACLLCHPCLLACPPSASCLSGALWSASWMRPLISRYSRSCSSSVSASAARQ
jgi:hypothetical protein